MTRFIPLSLIFFLSFSTLGKNLETHTTIRIDAPFSRATTGKNGAIFLTLKNETTHPRSLLKATVSEKIADHCELHTHIKEGSIFRMREVDALTIPEKGALVLKPGGLHIMLMGLKKPLSEDFFFELTLHFDKGETQTLMVPIKAAGAQNTSCSCGKHKK